ncbi:MAG: hypothetical protein M0Q92_04740 [Methanoregula sp.]|jgi:hypothetical protein|nr:hypothetical protein [Methanoregula sp.]
MTRHPEVPELVEQYMEASGTAGCWVTVREIRAHFNLDDSIAPALSGFLQKIYQGPFFTCRYKVARIEKFQDTVPPYRIISKYFVQERPLLSKHSQRTAECSHLQQNQ